jgi:hypothetical protein
LFQNAKDVGGEDCYQKKRNVGASLYVKFAGIYETSTRGKWKQRMLRMELRDAIRGET